MFLLEFEGKRLFRKYGIATPLHEVVECNLAMQYTPKIKYPLVIKGQYPGGGRGKAGAIKIVNNYDEYKSAVSQILNIRINGHTPKYILLEEYVLHENEYYLGIIISRFNRRIVILASKYGGVDIEELAKRPGGIFKVEINPLIGISPYQLRALSLYMFNEVNNEYMKLVKNLYELFINEELLLAEINPLIHVNGNFIALDSKVLIDENSSVRKDLTTYQSYLKLLSEGEKLARKYGFSYVPLDGDIAIISNGAGLTMATMDLVDYYGGKVGCFLDIGGGASAERVSKAIELILKELQVKAIFINIFGGITRCDEVAKGIISQSENLRKYNVKIVIRLVGTNEELTQLLYLLSQHSHLLQYLENNQLFPHSNQLGPS